MPVSNASAAASAGSTPEPEVKLGFINDWLISQVGFDANKIDRTKLKLGLRNVLDSVEPAISTPANVDAAIIASIENLVDKWVDGLKLSQPPVPGQPFIVGASTISTWKPTFTREQVEAEIIKKGGNPKKFSPFLLLILQWAPTLIQMITIIMNYLNPTTPPVVPPVVPPVTPPAAG